MLYAGKWKVTFNAPVVLGFTIFCFLALVLNWMTKGETNLLLFSTYRSSIVNPMTYLRMFTHVLGHANWEHFIGNMTLFLVIGPMLEEKYGSQKLLSVILVTAFVTGIANTLLFPNTRLLGASGIVFAMILMSSMTSMREGEIPLTFILVAVIYLGEQIYAGIFVRDNVSNLTHILGGIVGAVMGYSLGKKNI